MTTWNDYILGPVKRSSENKNNDQGVQLYLQEKAKAF